MKDMVYLKNGAPSPYPTLAAANLGYPQAYRKGKTVWVLKSGEP